MLVDTRPEIPQKRLSQRLFKLDRRFVTNRGVTRMSKRPSSKLPDSLWQEAHVRGIMYIIFLPIMAKMPVRPG